MAKKQTHRNIGIKVEAPTNEGGNDKNCPFTGTLPVRGRVFTGMVVSAKIPKMATVEWERRMYVPKYERFKKLRSKVICHNPAAVDAKLGDIVKIAETRPISKTKKFVIIEKVGREELVQDILEARESAAQKKSGEAKAQKKAAEKEEAAPEAPEDKE